MPDEKRFLVREEDGSSHYILEEGTGYLLLESGIIERSASLAATAGIAVRGSGPFAFRPRVSQIPVEALVQGAGKLRVSHEPVEVVVAPNNAKARESQIVAEVLVVPSNVAARVTQEVVEVLTQGASAARVSQEPVEVIMQNTDEQVNVEFIYWTVDHA